MDSPEVSKVDIRNTSKARKTKVVKLQQKVKPRKSDLFLNINNLKTEKRKGSSSAKNSSRSRVSQKPEDVVKKAKGDKTNPKPNPMSNLLDNLLINSKREKSSSCASEKGNEKPV